MSDLRIYINVSGRAPLESTATAACAEAPPTAPRATDACRMSVAVTTEGANPPAPRLIQFERQGDAFVLSNQNSAENLTWVSSSQNVSSVLRTLRVTSNLIRSMGRGSNNNASLSYFLWVSRYIVTGVHQHDSLPSTPSRLGDINMNEMLIELFSGSGSRGMVNLIGGLNVLRREPWIDEQARSRITSLTNLLDAIPIYQGLTQHFLNDEQVRLVGNLSNTQITQAAQIYQFLRRLAIAFHEGRPLRFDRTALEAYRAYNAFYAREIGSGSQPEFCAALEAGLREVGREGTAANFLGECRSALAWAEASPDQALRESARNTLTSSAGLQLLQQAIADESRTANMRVDWLSGRMAYRGVLDALLNRISLSGPEGQRRLHFDIASFAADLRRLTMLTSRGEYDLSALAFLRRLFGTEGEAPALRVFSDGVIGDVPWGLSAEDLTQIRGLQVSLRGRRDSSAGFAQVGMPVLLGTGCALGVTGAVLSETLPALRSNSAAQLGIGVPSAAIGGAGCFGLAGHYLWPAVVPNAVHNRYAWDIGSSIGGSLIGTGTFLLIHFLTQGNRMVDPAQRNPTDPFGP